MRPEALRRISTFLRRLLFCFAHYKKVDISSIFYFFFTRVYFTAQWCIVDLYFSFQPNSSLWLHWLKVVSVDSWNIFSNISLIKKSLICTICHHNSPVFGSSTEVHLGNSRLEGFAGRICSLVLQINWKSGYPKRESVLFVYLFKDVFPSTAERGNTVH